MISWTPRFIAALAFLALVGSAASNLLWFTELRRSQLVALTTWTLLTPVFGVTFGWLLLRDRLSGQELVGAALVLAALFLTHPPRADDPASLPRHRRPAPARPRGSS